MKKILLVSLLFTLCSSILMAQDQDAKKAEKKSSKVGSFLKRTGEVATGINMTDEVFIVNPSKSAMDVQFLACYGDPSTGKVSLVFKVKNKLYVDNATFGGSTSGNGESVAFDVNGKTYKPYGSAGKSYPVAKDIWTEVVLEGKDAFDKVPSTLMSFELVKLSFYFDASNRGILEFRNIPIVWQTGDIQDNAEK